MSVNIPEGKYQGIAVGYEVGRNSKDAAVVKVTMKVADGPYAGQTAQFSNGFGEKAAKFTKRALRTLGWVGNDINTAKDQILTNPKPVPMEIQTARYEDREWTTVRSIGTGGDGLKPLDTSMTKEVNKWLSEIPDEDSGLPF